MAERGFAAAVETDTVVYALGAMRAPKGIRSQIMSKAANYSVVELMRDGRSVEIRALRPDDRADFLAAVDRTSSQSLYRRFFSPKRSFTQEEVAHFLNPDFVNHVALVAVVDEPRGRVIVGGGRYIVVKPGKAEIAFAVIDEYQGQRIGAALMRHLAAIASEAGLRELVAEVLWDNISMLKLFEKSGLRLGTTRDAGVVHVTLGLV